MRVVFQMRAAAPRAIVAALAILAGSALGGCGQRGSLYLPTVPPMPAKPSDVTETPVPTAQPASAASSAEQGSVPDTTGTPLSLAPESELHATPDSAASAPQQPASGTAQAQ
ncbi:lipoprotein [Paraburkholderia sp.]|uniref:LPS translocon maturation chaperone LptM n=1 Tax=Paraburkholderia sp. TaxID=1926495 RepID=UPI00238D9ABF|nr:lipoprotein [Paraburkholderia sp.]MDE1180712.1 lipoprotein [Paraburkholderia sp.]